MKNKIKLGISSCLLGEKARYDGTHKLDPFLRDTLGKYVEYVPVCPEVECGFGIPREPMRLMGDPRSPRLVTVRTQVDYTERMEAWAYGRVAELEGEGLCGFIFKSGSPSSGIAGVKVYDTHGITSKTGFGIFGGLFMKHFPLLPVEQEDRLHDPNIRENFVEQIFTLKRWRETLSQRKSAGLLVDFHTKHGLLILSHSKEYYRKMGKLVAQATDHSIDTRYATYQAYLVEALRLCATPRKHVNVLLHVLGYFKKQLLAEEKEELLETIENYRGAQVPLIVPITLMNHYVRKLDQPYLKEQYYLRPHPLELQLRTYV